MNINITILGQAISFVIFVIFCMKYLWPPIISIIEKRQKEISDIFASIEESKKISKLKQIEAFNYLKNAKIEAQSIVLRANQYKTQLIAQAKHEAQIEREKILLKAYDEINTKKKCVAESLQQEIGTMIIFGIEKILESSVNKYLNEDMIDSVLKNLLHRNINNICHKE